MTNPSASPVAEASFLEPGSRVVGLTVDGVSRAYPINVLNWHELINDHLGHTELAITYCSLCDSVTVFDRRLDGQVFEFGVSGMVYLSNMLFFDRTDQALWSQMTSTAISGPHAGRTLRRIDGWEMTTFGAWRSGVASRLDRGQLPDRPGPCLQLGPPSGLLRDRDAGFPVPRPCDRRTPAEQGPDYRRPLRWRGPRLPDRGPQGRGPGHDPRSNRRRTRRARRRAGDRRQCASCASRKPVWSSIPSGSPGSPASRKPRSTSRQATRRESDE